MLALMMMMHDGPRVFDLSGLLIIVTVIGFLVEVGTLLLVVSILRLFLHYDGLHHQDAWLGWLLRRGLQVRGAGPEGLLILVGAKAF